MSSIVWGMDIGHSNLKAVRLEQAAEGAKVLGYAIEPIPSGEDVDRDKGSGECLIHACSA